MTSILLRGEIWTLRQARRENITSGLLVCCYSQGMPKIRVSHQEVAKGPGIGACLVPLAWAWPCWPLPASWISSPQKYEKRHFCHLSNAVCGICYNNTNVGREWCWWWNYNQLGSYAWWHEGKSVCVCVCVCGEEPEKRNQLPQSSKWNTALWDL